MIRLDRRACAFLAGLVALFALATGFKVHGSSIGIWRPILLEPGPDSSLLAGTPRLIRSDEWSITTLAMVRTEARVSAMRGTCGSPVAVPS